VRILRSFGFFVSTLVVYVGIPLLGWGLGDLSGFFSLGSRLAYALLVLTLGLAVGWQALHSPQGICGEKGQADKRIARQSVIRIIAILLFYLTLLFLPFADRRGIAALSQSLPPRWMGIVLFGLGMGLVFWSGVALGRLYSGEVTLQEDYRLVTDGPYRWVRHPRYASAVLLAFGLALTFNSWVGSLASATFIGIIMYRIRDQETLLKEAFGKHWDAYCAHTRRLIPCLY
jgi:protein-S-isoprenylcysteine O-methyltransferase Ste14